MGRNYWLYHSGKKGSRWKYEYEEGVIAIDSEIGDLSGKSNESIITALKERNKYNWMNFDSDVAILSIKFGDIIIVKYKGKIRGVGIADSKYAYSKQKYNFNTKDSNKDFGSYVKVNWIDELCQSEINKIDIKKYFASVEPVLKHLNHRIENRKSYDTFLEWFHNNSDIKKHIESYETKQTIKNMNKITINFPDAEHRKRIEITSVDIVAEYYKSMGYSIESVEHEKCGYDLIVANKYKEFHVEVKGTASCVEHFYITRNELECMNRDNRWVLALVTNTLEIPNIMIYSASDIDSKFIAKALAYEMIRIS